MDRKLSATRVEVALPAAVTSRAQALQPTKHINISKHVREGVNKHMFPADMSAKLRFRMI